MEEVPFEDRNVPLAEIEWDRSCWWWYPLTRAIQPAIKMLALATSLVAFGVIYGGVRLGDWLFKPSWIRPWEVVPTDIQPTSFATENGLQSLGLWVSAFTSFQQLGIRELAFVSFVIVWLALVLAPLGGILARRSLVELGQRTVAPWGESARLALRRWQSFLWATGMHLVGIVVMLLPIAIIGLLSRFGEIGATIGGILLLLCFPLVFGVGRFALSMIVCFPLSVCAIVAEKKADAFEGFSRSNAYFFQRPVVVGLCIAALVCIGLVGEQIIYWTLTLGWMLVQWTYISTGDTTAAASQTYLTTGSWLVTQLLLAYWFSFFWSGTAATYLVLRRSVDHTDLDELDPVDDVEKTALPEIPATPPTSAEPVETETSTES